MRTGTPPAGEGGNASSTEKGDLGAKSQAALATAILNDPDAPSGAHPAQKTVHAAAIPLLRLKGSLDGGISLCAMPDVNRGSVSNLALRDCHIATITSSGGVQPCEDDMPLLQSRPGSRRSRGSSSSPVQVAQVDPTKRHTPVLIKHITPLPYFGIDRMWDFGQVGTASLWKSGPLFSTGHS
jgi:hypothetical protein